jgi:hypothetical protein
MDKLNKRKSFGKGQENVEKIKCDIMGELRARNVFLEKTPDMPR